MDGMSSWWCAVHGPGALDATPDVSPLRHSLWWCAPPHPHHTLHWFALWSVSAWRLSPHPACAHRSYAVPELDAAAVDQIGSMSHVMFGGLTHRPAVRRHTTAQELPARDGGAERRGRLRVGAAGRAARRGDAAAAAARLPRRLGLGLCRGCDHGAERTRSCCSVAHRPKDECERWRSRWRCSTGARRAWRAAPASSPCAAATTATRLARWASATRSTGCTRRCSAARG